jgi:predicted nucleic acid-binding protein
MLSVDKNNIFVDINVLIGAWSNNATDKHCLQYLFSLSGKRIFISTLSVAQLVSVFQRKKNNEEIKKIVRYLLSKFTVLSFTDKDIEKSLFIENVDMEDNIQYVISRKFNCLHFITNNKKDYNQFYLLHIVSPAQIRVIKR